MMMMMTTTTTIIIIIITCNIFAFADKEMCSLDYYSIYNHLRKRQAGQPMSQMQFSCCGIVNLSYKNKILKHISNACKTYCSGAFALPLLPRKKKTVPFGCLTLHISVNHVKNTTSFLWKHNNAFCSFLR